MLETLKKDKLSQITLGAFALLTLWWIILFISESKTGLPNYLFGATYGPFMSLFGGIIGLYSSRAWGGWKSVIGRAIIMLSCGLLSQAFGQIVFSYYNLFAHIEIPYPSIADIGFFGYMPLYLLGMYMLAKASGVKINLQSFLSTAMAIIIPAGMLLASYMLFLKSYEFDWSQPVKIFLDFGYPLWQAFNVSIAIVIYSLSRKTLGGIMKNRILILLFAVVAQYIADSNFLYQSSAGTWYNAGYGDYLYLIAYTIMTLGLIQLHRVGTNLRTTK